MNNIDFFLSSSDYNGFEVPRACSIIKEVIIPEFSGKGLLVEISPPIIGQAYGFGGNDIHRLILTPRFEGVSLSAIHEWPCHVHILCSAVINEEDFSDSKNILKIAWGQIYQPRGVSEEKNRIL